MKKEGNYSKSWDYIKKIKNYIYFVIVLFLISIALGFIFPRILEEQIKKLIEDLAKQTEGMNFSQLFVFIFTNNLKTAFLGMVFGIIVLIPVFYCFFNGYVLGYVAKLVSDKQGFVVLLKILPHGVFEIPALFLSLSLGLKIGMFIFFGKKKKYLKESFENGFRIFVYVIIPLLLVAGVIEAGLIAVLS
ncbi:MAG: stage II sporulation protein M [Candidatus Pacearchaeota archaeon]|nr:stage II sporulation protein M [Candidatus Pacearchaeota archaeon]